MHGSVIFRLLDDACTFSAWGQMTDPEKVCVTKSLHIHFQKPIREGKIRAVGRITDTSQEVNEIYTEGILYHNEEEVARCSAVIARMRTKAPK